LAASPEENVWVWYSQSKVFTVEMPFMKGKLTVITHCHKNTIEEVGYADV